jgi:hypothetical protein
MKKPKYCKDCKHFERASGLCCFEKPEFDTVTGIKRIRIYKRNPEKFNINNNCSEFKKDRSALLIGSVTLIGLFFGSVVIGILAH